MPRSWDEGLRPKERANLIRRLHRVWVDDLTLEEVCDEMKACLRCRRERPGEMADCDSCGGSSAKTPCKTCWGKWSYAPCDLCGGAGIVGWFTVELVTAMVRDIGLPETRPVAAFCPTEAEIRLAREKIKMRWTTTQREASLRGTMNSGGDNGRGASDH
jgi:hypothetical protein